MSMTWEQAVEVLRAACRDDAYFSMERVTQLIDHGAEWNVFRLTVVMRRQQQEFELSSSNDLHNAVNAALDWMANHRLAVLAAASSARSCESGKEVRHPEHRA